MTSLHSAITAAADLIAQADLLLVAAGAGIGVDSGLPDFRGADGFWRAYPALRARGLSFTEVASPQTFDDDPQLAWGFYGHRLLLYRATQPHDGFNLLRRWSTTTAMGGVVFTSNVDGHFQRAGFGEHEVAECHGSLNFLQCSVPCGGSIWPADAFVPAIDPSACRLLGPAPRCLQCGAIARPNVLMFGDGAWLDSRASAQEARLQRRLDAARRIVVVEIGAGTAVRTVRSFSHALAIERDAVIVRINPREAEVPGAPHLSIPLGSLEALRRIDAAMATL